MKTMTRLGRPRLRLAKVQLDAQVDEEGRKLDLYLRNVPRARRGAGIQSVLDLHQCEAAVRVLNKEKTETEGWP